MERMEKLKEMLVAEPDDSFLKHALALEYIKIGDMNKAEELFRSVLAHDPLYTGSYYHLGMICLNRGDHAEAVRIFRKGIEACTQTGNRHSRSELQSALDEAENI